jgi:hypothetical protein
MQTKDGLNEAKRARNEARKAAQKRNGDAQADGSH